MTQSNSQPSQNEEEAKYKVELDSIDPERTGVKIRCPECGAISWLKLPDRRYYDGPISICCPTACGAFNLIAAFSPSASSDISIGDFDIHQKCYRDGAQFALNRAIYRCPLCAIESPREVMAELLAHVKSKAKSSLSRKELIDLLGQIVSTFDGVMRRCNSIVRRNYERMGLDPFPQVNSFQNLVGARNKMIGTWDMSSMVSDWGKLLLVFQKRHLFAHGLGVVDQEYIDKSGDTTATIGKQVSLSSEEVVFLAEETTKIVRAFFGMFLS